MTKVSLEFHKKAFWLKINEIIEEHWDYLHFPPAPSYFSVSPCSFWLLSCSVPFSVPFYPSPFLSEIMQEHLMIRLSAENKSFTLF